MFKKIISSLIIFSIFFSENAWCMRSSSKDVDDTFEERTGHFLTIRNLRDRAMSSGQDIVSSGEGTFSLKDMSGLIIDDVPSDSSLESPSITPLQEDPEFSILEPDESDSNLDFIGRNAESRPLLENTPIPTSGVTENSHYLPLQVCHPFIVVNSIDLENIPNLPSRLHVFMGEAGRLESGNLPQKRTLRFLQYAFDYINQEKLTRRQVLAGGLGGAVIALGVGSSIITLALDLAEKVVHIDSQDKRLINALYNTIYVDFMYNYVSLILMNDVMCRNSGVLSRFFAPSTKDFDLPQSTLKMIGARAIDVTIYGLSSLGGAILLYYFYQALTIQYDSAADSNIKENFPGYWGGYGLLSMSLVVDNMLYFGPRLSTQLRNFLDKRFFVRKETPSSQEKWRKDFFHHLKMLKMMFSQLNANEVSYAFEVILGPSLSLETRNAQLSSSLKATEVLRTLRAFQDYESPHDEHNHKTTLSLVRKRGATVIGWGLPLLGTVGRSIIYWYTIGELLESFGLEDEVARMIVSISLGGVIASLLEGKMEIDGVKEAFLKITGEIKDNVEQKLSLKRRIVNGALVLHDYFAGSWIAGVYTLTGFIATEGWNPWVRIALFAPTAVSSWLFNSMAFNESSSDVGDFVRCLDLTSHPNIVSQQRRRLIELTKSYIERFESLHPEIRDELYTILGSESDGEYLEIQEESKQEYFQSLSQSFVSHIRRFQKGEDTLALLQHIDEYLNQNKYTTRQALGSGIGGAFIGAMVYNPILTNVISSINSISFYITKNDKIYNILYLNLFPFWEIYSYLSVLDGCSRGASVVSKILRPSTDRFEEPVKLELFLKRTFQALGYGGATIASLTSIYLFFILEELNENDSQDFLPPWAFIQFGYTAPFLFLNSLFFYGPRISSYIGNAVDKVSLKFSNHLSFPSEEKRQQFLKEFKDLKWLFASLSDKDVHEVYEQVLARSARSISSDLQGREELQAAEALKTLWGLRQYHVRNKQLIPERSEEVDRMAFSKPLGLGVALCAFLQNVYLLYYIMSYFIGLTGLEGVAQTVLAGCIGTIGGMAKTSVEIEGAQKAIHNLTWEKKIGDDTSHGLVRKTLRRLGKAHNYLPAALLSLTTIGIGIAITNDWSLWPQLGFLIPLGVSDMFGNVLRLNQSFGDAAQFADRVEGKLTYLSADQKRNRLVDLTRRYRKLFKKLRSDLILKLDETLNTVQASQQ